MSKSIVKACVKYNDRLYTGFDHGECFRKLNEDNTIIVHSEIEQGFVDNDGNFVDRKQAMIIAKESGQLTYETDKKTLISEDLHLNWLNDQQERIAELEEQIDYIFKINTWLIKKYGKEFWQDIGINENDDTITNLIKLDEVFDKIYEEMNKEMPKKWYEYGFGGKK